LHKRTIALSIWVSLLAGSAFGQKVTVDWDKAVNFSDFKTWVWAKGTPAPNPLMDQRIVKAIEQQLAAKGLQKVEPGNNPDLMVTYAAATSSQTQLNTMNMGGYGPWRYGWGGTTTTTVEQIPVGHLVVDIGDIKTKDMIWRGIASDTLSDNPQKNEKKINNAAAKMFKKYPPPKGK
jgi:Domain of unknown function (DUF4136)